MKTQKLYEQDPELRRFTAEVIACEAIGDRYAVVLDRTAFFPEGGGQPADHGTMGDVRVLDVRTKGEVIVHTTDGPASGTVECTLDAQRRQMLTQQHSGEHIFSGIVHQLYGYDNVGFHMGTDAVTMDFNGMLTEEQVQDVERRVNEVIWADVPVEVFVPAPEELSAIPYRSKKELTGDVRIVRIPGADTCACCGTHVARTGSIGQLKVLGVQKYKSGVRVSILCGMRALDYEREMQEQLRRTSVLLSAKQDSVADQVEKLLAERDRLRYEREALAMKLFASEIAGEQDAVRVNVTEHLSAGQLRKAASMLAAGCEAGLVLLREGELWNFALCSETRDIRGATKALLAAFDGKGGGPRDMTQGKLGRGEPEEIRRVLISSLEA